MGNSPSDALPTPTQNDSSVSYTSFVVNEPEREAAAKVCKVVFDYFFLKEACLSNCRHIVDLKTFCGLSLKFPNVQ